MSYYHHTTISLSAPAGMEATPCPGDPGDPPVKWELMVWSKCGAAACADLCLLQREGRLTPHSPAAAAAAAADCGRDHVAPLVSVSLCFCDGNGTLRLSCLTLTRGLAVLWLHYSVIDHAFVRASAVAWCHLAEVAKR